ncbi:Protein of unknown function [Lentibacillus halodurans]|uniref:DUF1232 domain-containing protein n=1 Tax=Lentibacillus halodurans TaxID=237679 RepID=A0A1I0XXH9_9BACI|nr:DUF1232 domain-containing protein [Lentibacillus halodurans]SFB04643.1 Protein of unknown function [Lentibacillus halodurans]
MRRLLKRIGFLFKFHKSFPFFIDFFRSAQLEGTTKFVYVLLIIGYIVFPFDIIPDFLYVFGIVDDITVAAFLLQRMVKVAPESLKEKHHLK